MFYNLSYEAKSPKTINSNKIRI